MMSPSTNNHKAISVRSNPGESTITAAAAEATETSNMNNNSNSDHSLQQGGLAVSSSMAANAGSADGNNSNDMNMSAYWQHVFDDESDRLKQEEQDVGDEVLQAFDDNKDALTDHDKLRAEKEAAASHLTPTNSNNSLNGRGSNHSISSTSRPTSRVPRRNNNKTSLNRSISHDHHETGCQRASSRTPTNGRTVIQRSKSHSPDEAPRFMRRPSHTGSSTPTPTPRRGGRRGSMGSTDNTFNNEGTSQQPRASSRTPINGRTVRRSKSYSPDEAPRFMRRPSHTGSSTQSSRRRGRRGSMGSVPHTNDNNVHDHNNGATTSAARLRHRRRSSMGSHTSIATTEDDQQLMMKENYRRRSPAPPRSNDNEHEPAPTSVPTQRRLRTQRSHGSDGDLIVSPSQSTANNNATANATWAQRRQHRAPPATLANYVRRNNTDEDARATKQRESNLRRRHTFASSITSNQEAPRPGAFPIAGIDAQEHSERNNDNEDSSCYSLDVTELQHHPDHNNNHHNSAAARRRRSNSADVSRQYHDSMSRSEQWHGSHASGRRGPRHHRRSHSMGSVSSQESEKSRSNNISASERSDKQVLAVAEAVVVDDADNYMEMLEQRETLTQKQKELQEQEIRIAEQFAKLKAWEESLKQRQQEQDEILMQKRPMTTAVPGTSNHSYLSSHHSSGLTEHSVSTFGHNSGISVGMLSVHDEMHATTSQQEEKLPSLHRAASAGDADLEALGYEDCPPRTANPQRAWSLFANRARVTRARRQTMATSIQSNDGTVGSSTFSRRRSSLSHSPAAGMEGSETFDGRIRAGRRRSTMSHSTSYDSRLPDAVAKEHPLLRMRQACDDGGYNQFQSSEFAIPAQVELASGSTLKLATGIPVQAVAPGVATLTASLLDDDDPIPALSGHMTVESGLGIGPMRFAPPPNPLTLVQHLALLDKTDQRAFRSLQQKWEDRQVKLTAKYGKGKSLSNKKNKKAKEIIDEFTDDWHWRFLYLYAKRHPKTPDEQRSSFKYKFPVDKVWAAEKKLKKRFVTLSSYSLEHQLRSKTLFPVPGLKSIEGNDMFYMRPSRYFPNETSAKTIIDNLCYVMNTMLENNLRAQQEGIGFVACMDDWKMQNFDINYCYQFMMGLQGFLVPVRVRLFCIVNPPSWFGAIWKLMKPMLAPSFRKRVKICPESKLHKYLMPNYERYLPDDMQTGTVNTNAMVNDFISYRHHVERYSHGSKNPAESHKDSHSFSYGSHDASDHSSSGIGSYHLGSRISSNQGSASRTGSSNMDASSDDIRSVDRWSQTDSDGCSRFSSVYDDHHDDHSDHDGASIHCEIDDEEMLEEEDMKQAASTVQISNLQAVIARQSLRSNQ